MPNVARKPDDDAIAAVIDAVAARGWRGKVADWPGHLYHLTDVRNAASILAGGALLSRAEATRRGLMANDNANPHIITEAPEWLRSQVRLYFRPRTPTFAANEGLHVEPASSSPEEDAHCPVPVAFVLDAPAVLGMAGSRFSRGSLARWTVELHIGDDAEFLAALPWDDIYDTERILSSSDCLHEDDLPEDMIEVCRHSNRIRYHRQSEVIVPDRLPLDSLVRVGVRTRAEWSTLQSLLADLGASPDLMARVGVDTSLFWGWRPHAQDARYDPRAGTLRVTFNPGMTSGVTLAVAARWESENGRVIAQDDLPRFRPNLSLRLAVPPEIGTGRFRLTLRAGDAIVFSGWFTPDAEAMIAPAR